jgi:hypothetical protein
MAVPSGPLREQCRYGDVFLHQEGQQHGEHALLRCLWGSCAQAHPGRHTTKACFAISGPAPASPRPARIWSQPDGCRDGPCRVASRPSRAEFGRGPHTRPALTHHLDPTGMGCSPGLSQGIAPDNVVREWVLQYTIDTLGSMFQDGKLNLPGKDKPEKDPRRPTHRLSPGSWG